MYFQQLSTAIFFTVFSIVCASAQNNRNSIDSSRFNGLVNTIIVLDGKMIFGRSFNAYNIQERRGIIRLNADGIVDNSFAIGGGFSGEVNAVALHHNGKLKVGGGFTNYDGASCNKMACLNGDGTLDNSFGGETGFDTKGHGGALVSTIALTPDVNILAAGIYKSYDSELRNNITELDKNGKFIKTFLHELKIFRQQ